ncbi:MAG: ATP-binding protein [Candidatus Solibacter usitatus]|nr:ATP-binding protein [Candidatus Solibacter usitatus]
MGNLAAEPGSGGSRLNAVYNSELESVDAAETAVTDMAKAAGFDEDDLHKIGIALREAMVNAVVHGNQYNAAKKVRMDAWLDNGALHVVIADEGKGFEVTNVPDPLAQENLLKESGRGILLMQAFVDEFQVRRLKPNGTEVTMVKYLASR